MLHESDTAPGIRVIVCDDDADLRLLVRVLLMEDPRIQVVGEAANGLEAVEAATEQTPDVVVLNISMPRMGGNEALPLIRRASPHSKIVVFTGYDRQQAPAMDDPDAFVQKGGPPEEIVHVVRTAGAQETAA